jgi:GPH family glycoside/pentoside/hexuronide:cation symporter
MKHNSGTAGGARPVRSTRGARPVRSAGTTGATAARGAAGTSRSAVTAGIGIMASFGVGRFLAEALTGAFGSLVFKYYETEVGMSGWWVALAIGLYSLWNAVNDPLIGWFTAKPTPLSARFGRRFPWIVSCALLSLGSFFLVFAFPAWAGPAASVGLLFALLLLSTFIFDALYSAWEVNYQSVFPDRFRGTDERARAAGIGTAIGTVGVAAGFVVPTLFVRYGEPSTYVTNAAWFAVGGIVLVALLVPGVRETRPMIDRYLAERRDSARKEQGFFRQLAGAMANRDFLAFILLYFFYQSAMLSMTASVYYVGDYILGRSTTLIMAAMLVGALLGLPVWTRLARKLENNQGLLAASAIALAVACVPMVFELSYWGYVASMAVWGAAFGGFWMLIAPAMADVIDGIVAKTGRRDDGVYLGFRAFFGRLAWLVQALAFAVVHELTSFAADPRSPKAILGIRLHQAAIPAVLLLVGFVVFKALNTITPESARRNRELLKKKGW